MLHEHFAQDGLYNLLIHVCMSTPPKVVMGLQFCGLMTLIMQAAVEV